MYLRKIGYGGAGKNVSMVELTHSRISMTKKVFANIERHTSDNEQKCIDWFRMSFYCSIRHNGNNYLLRHKKRSILLTTAIV
jgi:hypothetical protein